MSSSDVSSSGEWLAPPFRLRTKSIAVGTPAAASTIASWPAPLAGDCGDDAEGLAGALQDGPLLDVQLDEGIRELRQPPRAHRPGLLRAEDRDAERRVAQPLRRLDRRDDAEHAVEAPAVRNRVQVRPGPDARVSAPADQVSRAVDRDLEPGLAQPPCGEPVCLVLLR